MWAYPSALILSNINNKIWVIYLSFGGPGFSLLHGLFSHCREQGLLTSWGARASHLGGFSCCGAWALEPRLSSEAHGLSCSEVRGIFPDQGLNPYPLHWQADRSPLSHPGSPNFELLEIFLVHWQSSHSLTHSKLTEHLLCTRHCCCQLHTVVNKAGQIPLLTELPF